MIVSLPDHIVALQPTFRGSAFRFLLNFCLRGGRRARGTTRRATRRLTTPDVPERRGSVKHISGGAQIEK